MTIGQKYIVSNTASRRSLGSFFKRGFGFLKFGFILNKDAFLKKTDISVMCTSGCLCQGALVELPQESPEGLNSPQGWGGSSPQVTNPLFSERMPATLGLFPMCMDSLPTVPVLSSNYAVQWSLTPPACLTSESPPVLIPRVQWRSPWVFV